MAIIAIIENGFWYQKYNLGQNIGENYLFSSSFIIVVY